MTITATISVTTIEQDIAHEASNITSYKTKVICPKCQSVGCWKRMGSAPNFTIKCTARPNNTPCNEPMSVPQFAAIALCHMNTTAITLSNLNTNSKRPADNETEDSRTRPAQRSADEFASILSRISDDLSKTREHTEATASEMSKAVVELSSSMIKLDARTSILEQQRAEAANLSNISSARIDALEEKVESRDRSFVELQNKLFIQQMTTSLPDNATSIVILGLKPSSPSPSEDDLRAIVLPIFRYLNVDPSLIQRVWARVKKGMPFVHSKSVVVVEVGSRATVDDIIRICRKLKDYPADRITITRNMSIQQRAYDTIIRRTLKVARDGGKKVETRGQQHFVEDKEVVVTEDDVLKHLRSPNV